MGKLPGFTFYPGDWMKDPELRSVSSGARGLWIDMLSLMFESARRGYLQFNNGKIVSAESLARMTGNSTDDASCWLRELEYSGVLSRSDDGCIYSRRQVRDEREREQWRNKKQTQRSQKGQSDDVPIVVPGSVPNLSVSESEDEVPSVDLVVQLEETTYADWIYSEYPRKVGKRGALNAIAQAVKRMIAGENGDKMEHNEAVNLLRAKAMQFAKSPAGKNGTFTPHPATWFNASRYLDDEQEWYTHGERVQPQTVSKAEQRDQRIRESSRKVAEYFGIHGDAGAPGDERSREGILDENLE